MFEGDPAPTDCFQELVSIKTGEALGEQGAARLVPWLHKNPERHGDYLAILTDPRKNSPELRQTIKSLSREIPERVLDHLIVVNADTNAENRRYVRSSILKEIFCSHVAFRWMKKNKMMKIMIYADEKMEWLRKYSALGTERFSMCFFVIKDGKVNRVARDVDGVFSTKIVANAVRGL